MQLQLQLQHTTPRTAPLHSSAKRDVKRTLLIGRADTRAVIIFLQAFSPLTFRRLAQLRPPQRNATLHRRAYIINKYDDKVLQYTTDKSWRRGTLKPGFDARRLSYGLREL